MCTGTPTKKGCKGSYNLGAMPLPAIKDLSKACALEWPCKVSCSRNYAAPCPRGFAPTGNGGMCSATTYQGQCEKSMNTATMNEQQKRELELVCGVRFPCA